MCGGMDPLLDDAVDFYTKLKTSHTGSNPKRSKHSQILRIFRSLPHGFWSLSPFASDRYGMPGANDAINLAIDWVTDLCYDEDRFFPRC